jgi:hypothetical protein
MILRDPVHGLVAFESEEEAVVEALLGAVEVQRLRRIRQLGLTALAYPGADHTRFAHAIGAAFVMKLLIARLRSIQDTLPFWQRITTERARDALAAALLHDVGHGPFSHLFEEALPGTPRHEEWTARIILDPSTEVHRTLAKFDPYMPGRVAELVRGRHELTFLARSVSGTFDVDRCDYLLRDAYATGVSYGTFDLDWLLRSLRFGVASVSGAVPPLAVDGPRGLPAIESFILARLFMFQQVYFHKASRSSEWMLITIFRRVRALLEDGTRLPGVPKALESLIRKGDAALDDYLALDDCWLLVALDAWRSVKDPVLSDLTTRLHTRRLFKTFELYGNFAGRAARQTLLERARQVATAHGVDADVYVGLDAVSDVPFDDREDSLAVIFPDGKPSKPGDVSFLLGRLRGQALERARLIFPVELRDAIIAELAL